MNENLEEPVPKNRAGEWKIGSLRIRKLIEAAIMIVPIICIIVSIPFIVNVKITLCLIFAMTLLIINIIGIKNRTLSEAFYAYLKNKANRRSLRLGSVADENRADVFNRNSKKTITSKAQNYFSDDNLRGSDDTKKILAKGAKQFVTNIKDNIGL